MPDVFFLRGMQIISASSIISWLDAIESWLPFFFFFNLCGINLGCGLMMRKNMTMVLSQLRTTGLLFYRNVSTVVTWQFHLQNKSQLFWKHKIKGHLKAQCVIFEDFEEERAIFNLAPPPELTRELQCSEHPNLESLSTFFFVSLTVDTNL